MRWCLTNLTPGERAFFYKLLHGHGIRYADCDDIIRKEKKTCSL